MSLSPQRGQHLFLPPAQLQTHIHSRSRYRTDLPTTGEGSNRGVPRLSNSRLQLERPGARAAPGMEKLPQTSQAPLCRRSNQPRRRGAEGGADGPRKDAELTCDPAGERFHSPAYSAGHLSAPGRTEGLPFPLCLFPSFRLPLSLPKGVRLKTWRSLFSRGLSGRCVSGSTPRERTNGIFKSPVPGCSPSLYPPSLRIRLRERAGVRKTPDAGRPREGSRAAPTRGTVGGCDSEVWIDFGKKKKERQR